MSKTAVSNISAGVADILRAHRQWLESGQKQGQRADFSGVHLDGIDLAGVDLSAAVFKGASLRAANLAACRLIHADFSDACMQGAALTRANLLLTDFSGADLREADLSEATVSSDSELGQMRRGPRFKDADLQDANLQNCYCYISEFCGANLSGANLSGAMLERANLSANNLAGINCRDANMSGVNLESSDLSGTDLRGAYLVHANLTQTLLSGADVSGAHLKSANFADAKVDNISYNRKTLFRGIRVVSCYGSSRFRRFAQDQDYIEEFKDAYPFLYYIWLGLTDCGRSLFRVVFWCLVLALGFGVIYFLLGEHAFEINHKETLSWSLFTTIYYSIVTFTTLGFGDITPRTPLAASVVIVEVIVGYLMLGILISILATKVARRS